MSPTSRPNQLPHPEEIVTTQYFGVEIIHRQQAESMPAMELSAHDAVLQLIDEGDHEQADELLQTIAKIQQFVDVHQETADGFLEMADIFTANQLDTMRLRVESYLGQDIDSFLKEQTIPQGYAYYVGRLAMYFASGDDTVTSKFGEFERTHTEPIANARGPQERNSRQYAMVATEKLLQQFDEYYQVPFTIKLNGPLQDVHGSQVSWGRGVAESQFLILDYMRDQLIGSSIAAPKTPDTMTVEDIAVNMHAILSASKRLDTEISAINPLLAGELRYTIMNLSELTAESMHRGRRGVPRYQKEPEKARRAILRAELLLTQADDLTQKHENQAEIPILDI